MENLWLPKSIGGQNLINLKVWNNAAILKLLQAMHEKKDCPYIKCIHTYYIKGEGDVKICVILPSATWVIRKILDTRKVLRTTMGLGSLRTKFKEVTLSSKFSIHKIYTSLISTHRIVCCKNISLQPYIYPKHQFIKWLATQRRLASVERLIKIDIQVPPPPPKCSYCAAAKEIIGHLYFQCPTTRALWTRIMKWLGINRKIGSWQDELRWAKNGTGAIISYVFAMVVYVIWRKINITRFRSMPYHCNRVRKEIGLYIQDPISLVVDGSCSFQGLVSNVHNHIGDF